MQHRSWFTFTVKFVAMCTRWPADSSLCGEFQSPANREYRRVHLLHACNKFLSTSMQKQYHKRLHAKKINHRRRCRVAAAAAAAAGDECINTSFTGKWSVAAHVCVCVCVSACRRATYARRQNAITVSPRRRRSFSYKSNIYRCSRASMRAFLLGAHGQYTLRSHWESRRVGVGPGIPRILCVSLEN